MKSNFLHIILAAALALVACGLGHAQTVEAGGTITRGENSGKVTNCYWGNNRKWIGVQKEPYRQVYADFNFAAEVTSGTYTFTTFADEHILDGGYTWGGVFIQDDGGESTIVSGTLEITVKEDYCKLKATGKDEDGKEVTVTWEGPMKKTLPTIKPVKELRLTSANNGRCYRCPQKWDTGNENPGKVRPVSPRMGHRAHLGNENRFLHFSQFARKFAL